MPCPPSLSLTHLVEIVFRVCTERKPAGTGLDVGAFVPPGSVLLMNLSLGEDMVWFCTHLITRCMCAPVSLNTYDSDHWG